MTVFFCYFLVSFSMFANDNGNEDCKRKIKREMISLVGQLGIEEAEHKTLLKL